jgi:hypothetical protein
MTGSMNAPRSTIKINGDLLVIISLFESSSPLQQIEYPDNEYDTEGYKYAHLYGSPSRTFLRAQGFRPYIAGIINGGYFYDA